MSTGTVNWSEKGLPRFDHMKAYVLPGAFYGDTLQLFAACGFQKAATIDEADVVVFIGGADVDPSLYNQKSLPTTYTQPNRDKVEILAYEQALAKNKFMFGICRGAQFLHVMNGGELWQDVNSHAGPDHWIVDLDDDFRVLSNSLHHQMIKASDDLQIIAVTEKQTATVFKDENLFVNVAAGGEDNPAKWSNILEVEAGYYINTGCFFVQGHPEVSDNMEYVSWCMYKLHEFLNDWQAVTFDMEVDNDNYDLSYVVNNVDEDNNDGVIG